MKKIYALLLGLVAVAWLAFAPAAQAQYTVENYTISTDNQPYVTINGNGGIEITQITPQNQSDYNQYSSDISMGFSTQFLNYTSDHVKVDQNGNVIFGGSDIVPDGSTQRYGYRGSCNAGSAFAFTPQGQESIFNIGYLYSNQFNFGSPTNEVEQPNHTMVPWNGYHSQLGSWNGYAAPNNTKFMYMTQGVAPFRTFTVESCNMSSNYIGYQRGNWQVVIFEAGGYVSKIRYNYQTISGSNSWYNYGYQIGCGMRDFGGQGVTDGALSLNAIQLTPPSVPTASHQLNSSCYDNENNLLPNYNIQFVIRYPNNLSFTNPQNSPVDRSILPLLVPVTPKIAITNEGSQPFNLIEIRVTITRLNDPNNPLYNQAVILTNAQLPAANGGTSPIITFPQFTPQSYGTYTITYTADLTAPLSQFLPVFTSTFVCSPADNVTPTKLLSPLAGLFNRTPLNTPIPVQFEYQNIGTHNQTNVPVSVYITNPQGAVVYRDTVIVNNWLSTQIRDTQFKDWTPTQLGNYTICGMTLLSIDLNHSDDTLCVAPVVVRYGSDVQAFAIINPADGEEKPEKKEFNPQAYFVNFGVQDLFDVPVEVIIKRCSDDQVVFKADTIMPELNVDVGKVKMGFPSKGTAGNDIATLAPGCYNLCAIAKEPSDADRSNDTTCQFFTIIPRLQGEINVGVGQRFQTISAACDSMRFRGVGPGNLNLWFTDNAYTENGNTSVSTPNAMIEMRDIVGAGPNVVNGKPVISFIKWQPRPGVHPVITFSGFQPYCISWSYKSSNYMTWDGNNQFAVTPDLPIAEPAKRGITIINNGTSGGGGIFDLEFARQNITLKNMILRNAGNITNISSAIVTLSNNYNSSTFLAGVTDTGANHHIIVDNCEMGNSNTGIFDVGTTPLFDQNTATFFDRRNHDDRFTRNTIGTATNTIGSIGIRFGNEDGLYIGHNEISNILNGNQPYTAGIVQNSGNTINCWVDANRIHNVKAGLSTTNTLAGIDIQQFATVYTVGSGTSAKNSQLPTGTRNRVTNNMIYDLRYITLANTLIEPLTMSTRGVTVAMTAGGNNYTSPPTVTISGGGGTGALAVATLTSVQSVNAIFVTVPGVGYTSAPTLTISGGGGTGATAVVVLNNYYFTDNDSVFNNSISVKDANPAAIVITRSGMPFIWDNIVQDLNVSASATATLYNLTVPRPWYNFISADYNLFNFRENISSVTLNSLGGGYTSAPNVNFVGGGGTGATATATFIPQLGTVSGIVLTSSGQGYTSAPTITITPQSGGPGSGATATAIFGGVTPFATVYEFDRPTGTYVRTTTIKSLTEWRTYTGQDVHSITGDPIFASDSLHLPLSITRIYSPASNNGITLNTGTQTLDFDGEPRIVSAATPDIGADEFDGFQYVNDLAVLDITKPAGITDNTGAITVTAENPLPVQGIVKNEGLIAVTNRSAHALTEVSTNGGVTWSTYFAPGSNPNPATVTGINLNVGESKVIDFAGPTITNEVGKFFRVTIFVDPDQNNSNNTISKTFKMIVKRAALLVSWYNDQPNNLTLTPGRINRDSVLLALNRLSIPFDTIDRAKIGSGSIDYTPWWTIIWCTGDPTANPPYTAGALDQRLGIAAISLKEEDEIIRYLRAGQTYAKKSFIIAGENIAMFNDTTSIFRNINNPITDNELMTSWFHTQFVARWPVLNFPVGNPTQYSGAINGVGNYFRFPDNILSQNARVASTPSLAPIANAGGPNVIKVNPATGIAGDNVSRVAYTYALHASTPLDSGAGTAWTGATYNVVFYPFDWADGKQASPNMDGQVLAANVSGTTRILRGALDFINSFKGVYLPVEFEAINGVAKPEGNLITWSVAAQKDVDHYEVEMQNGSDWAWAGEAKASQSQTDYSFTHTANVAFETGKTFTYRVVAVDLDGARTTSNTTSFDRNAAGAEFSVEQNFPNPFNTSTVMNFTLPENGTLTLRVLDMTGKVVAMPIDGASYTSGKSQLTFEAANLASGTYIYELSFTDVNGVTSKLSRKMTLTK